MSLALGEWVKAGYTALITGTTSAGKSWLACALAQHACRRGHSALYQRVPRLGKELRIWHANGTFTRWLDTLKNKDVLLLADWGMTAMDGQTRADLLEIIDTGPVSEPSSPPSFLPSNGTSGSATRLWPMRCLIDSCKTITASRSRADRCARKARHKKANPVTDPPHDQGPPAAWQGPMKSTTAQYRERKTSRKSKPA